MEPTTTDWIQTTVGALALIGTWIGMWRKSAEANDAKIAAKAAQDRADEALEIARKALGAVDGLREIEAGRDRIKALEAEAPARLLGWITNGRAKAMGRGSMRPQDLTRSPRVHFRVPIETEGDLIAAQLAVQHEEVLQIDPPVPTIGRSITIFVKNPHYRG